MVSKVEGLLPETYRERLFSPTETLSMFLSQAMNEDRSCQKVVNDIAVRRALEGRPLCSTNTGGYCQARQRLSTEMVCELARHIGHLIDNSIPNEWRWKGKRVRLIDGTTIALPDTKANQAAYPQPSTQESGAGYPIVRVVGVICLSSGALLNSAMSQCSGKGTGEQALLRSMLDTFSTGDLVLGDALFGDYFLLASLQEAGIDAVFEQMGARKLTTDFRKGKRLSTKDHLMSIPKPNRKPDWMAADEYESLPDQLVIRELSVGGKILITTLLSPKMFPKHALKSLYKDRWHVEVDLRNIKTTLGMDMLTCQTPEMIKKEMWVYFMAYNLLRLLMAQSALLADVLPRQLSFKHTIQIWVAWCQQSQGSTNQKKEGMLFILIAQKRVGNRPGRLEPRMVKRRPKAFPRLMELRSRARERISKHWHQ